jgi:hypothetical protein
MASNYRFLSRGGPVTAIAGWLATPEERQRALRSYEAQDTLASVIRDGGRPTLIALHTLATGIAPLFASAKDSAMYASRVGDAIASGRLVMVDGWGSGRSLPDRGAADMTAPPPGQAATLVAEVMGERSEFTFEGQRYRLTTAAEASGGAKREGFVVVGTDRARALLPRMAKRFASKPAEGKAWTELAGLLSPAVAEEDRLVVLCHQSITRPSAPTSQAPTATPSQVRDQIAEEHWIEVEIVYEDGTPYEGDCTLELPDGRKTKGPPGAKGIVRIDGTTPGSCQLSFEDLDAASVAAG